MKERLLPLASQQFPALSPEQIGVFEVGALIADS
jgi:hypothetical protein